MMIKAPQSRSAHGPAVPVGVERRRLSKPKVGQTGREHQNQAVQAPSEELCASSVRPSNCSSASSNWVHCARSTKQYQRYKQAFDSLMSGALQ